MAHDLGAGVMAGRRSSWSADDDLVLAQCYAAGRPVGQTANLVGRSRNAVIGRAHRLGLQHSRPFNRLEFLPEEPAEPPAPAVEPHPVEEPDPKAPWQCREPHCRGTRQPGRDSCAECITEKRRAAWRQ